MWIRFLLIGFFSLTSFALFAYQGIEISKAYIELFKEFKQK
jgi:hypothetical protein